MSSTLAPSSAAAQPPRSPSPIQLEPFVHQVGGHFPIVCLDGTTVCKPLNDREHRFYQTMPEVLKPFAPSFEGTMKVETAEDEEGYIMLRGQPPPNYHRQQTNNATGTRGGKAGARKTHRRQHSSLQYRLKRKESIEIESVVKGQQQDGTSEDFVVSASAPARAQSMPPSPPEDSFYNPWALKCHRDHLKKLGMLRPPSSPHLQQAAEDADVLTSSEETSMQLQSNIGEEATSKKKKKGSGSDSSSRANPQMYLLLENLVWRYRRPCVLDLKVGSRQYADDSSASKKQRKMAKAAATTSGTLGLRVCGMQVYCVATGRYACHNKYYGRSLDDSGFRAAIVEYLTGGGGGELRIDVLDRLVERLSELKGVLCELDTFRFYTSSLLITYDGGNGSNHGGSEEEEEEVEEDIVDLRIIDFAHSTHEGMRDAVLHVGPDGGFVFGLTNFIEILGEIKAHNGVLDLGGDDADVTGSGAETQKSAVQ